MAAMAGLSCLFVVTNAVEPRSYYRRVADSKGAPEGNGKAAAGDGEKEGGSTGARVLERARHIYRGVVLVFRTPSFLLILAGNIIGTIVAGNMGYKVMYLQVSHLHPGKSRTGNHPGFHTCPCHERAQDQHAADPCNGGLAPSFVGHGSRSPKPLEFGI